MDRVKQFFSRLLREDQGQDLIEYALLATFVSLVAIAGATLLGTALNTWYETVSGRVDEAAGEAGGGSAQGLGTGQGRGGSQGPGRPDQPDPGISLE